MKIDLIFENTRAWLEAREGPIAGTSSVDNFLNPTPKAVNGTSFVGKVCFLSSTVVTFKVFLQKDSRFSSQSHSLYHPQIFTK